MKTIKKSKILSVIITALILLQCVCFVSCSKEQAKDIIIIYTNDVHARINDNIGYAGLAAYKNKMLETGNYVTLIDVGDSVQGNYIAAASKGEKIVDIMNEVGYDIRVIGNHEFDYGVPQLKNIIAKSSSGYISCNIKYTGKKENLLSDLKPYKIIEYGDVKVAYIGVTTPFTYSTVSPYTFKEDGETVYSFCADNGAKEFYDVIQQNIDKCRNDEGADYVVITAHCGTDEEENEFKVSNIIANISGVDVFISAHSHSEIASTIVKDKDGKDVAYTQTGTQLKNIGKVVISANGTITTTFIDSYEDKDAKIEEFIKNIEKDSEEFLNQKVAHIDFDLSCNDENGIRMIRTREKAIGNLVADAYRIIGNADIGMCNGGGVRADLKTGDITYNDIINVNPYGNSLCVVKMTGAEILDALELFYESTMADYVKDGKAYGENGSFQQVSGLKFTINTNIPTSIVKDEMECLVSVGDTRRVSDVMVLQDGEYVPIEKEKTYTVASHDYMIKRGGSGMANLLANHELVLDEAEADYQLLIDYIVSLNGDFSAYQTEGDRITIK